MKKYYVGIDGGGTYTKAVVVSESGELVLRVGGETINYCAVSFDTARKNLETVFDKISESVDQNDISRVFIGCSALESRADAETVKKLMGRYSHLPTDMDSDLFVALYGHSFGKAGAMLISGTGSMGVAQTEDGSVITCGGWGYVFGDEGSAYHIATEGLRHVSKMADGREKKTPLYFAALKYYGVNDPYEIIDKIYLSEFSRKKIAEFATVVSECAECDTCCVLILDNAACALYETARTLLKKAKISDSLAVYGGVLLNNERILSTLNELLLTDFPDITVSFPEALPEFGAVAAAMDKDGVLSEEIKEKLCALK